MAASIQASETGLQIVDQARRKQGWTKKAATWCDAADGLSPSTLDRFWAKKLIARENFVAICAAVGIKDWEAIADLPSPTAIYPAILLPIDNSQALFSDLETFLQNCQWEEADGETARLMIRLSGDKSETEFRNDTIDDFPCRELLEIDDLWRKYSHGKFGFTIQKNIWSGSRRDFTTFSERVGWKLDSTWLKVSDLKYDITAPQGHLPSLHWIHIEGFAVGSYSAGHDLYGLLEKLLFCLA